ncbi:MAG: NTP transferase domain-containing protein [Coriobacteriia bacterium]|nr:NTP transferase domain-containing protein [Coriobacteriia bacterium]
MNQPALLCRLLAEQGLCSAEELASQLGTSLDCVRELISTAQAQSHVQLLECNSYQITEAGRNWLEQFRVDNAIILTAGFGTRLAPYTLDTPKGLLKVRGTPMVERQIEQLHAAGITEIILVVGYLAEKFEYLRKKQGVTLVYNPEYASKNNYASLYCVREYLGNSYISVGDHWIEENIFHTFEPNSWFSSTYVQGSSSEWRLEMDPDDRVINMDTWAQDDWVLMGPGFFTREFSKVYRTLLEEYYERGAVDYFWEHLIWDHFKRLPAIYLNRQDSANVIEIETPEDLYSFDPSYLECLPRKYGTTP